MIRARNVRAADGSSWTVRRRFAPRPTWRRIRLRRSQKVKPDGRKVSFWDFLDPFDFLIDGIDGLTALLFVIGLILFIVFMIFVGIPLLIFLVETLLIIPVLLVVGAFVRILFRRPWTIEATRASIPAQRIGWNVVGWRASGRAADRMVSAIRAAGGVSPEPPLNLVPPRAHRRVPR